MSQILQKNKEENGTPKPSQEEKSTNRESVEEKAEANFNKYD